MPDFDKPVRKNVKQEPPNELIGVHGHDLAFVVIVVIAPSERDGIVFELHEPMVADRDPVGISAEILKNVFGLLEGRFAIDDPFLLVELRNQGIKGPRRRKAAYVAGVNELVL
jgi:hypothetical protein